MKYKTKSIIIGRMKRVDHNDALYPVFITLFDINEPHKSGDVPKQRLEFQVENVVLNGFDNVNYLLAGNDIEINNLIEIDVEQKGKTVVVSGK